MNQETNQSLNAAVASAQVRIERDSKPPTRKPARAGSVKRIGVIALWVLFAGALLSQRDALMGTPGVPSDTDIAHQMRSMLEHAALDVAHYRNEFGELPHRVPVDFYQGVIQLEPAGNGYSLTTSFDRVKYTLLIDADDRETFTAIEG